MLAWVQATAELYDEEGFQRTGDVCEQQGPDVFVWIDRVSNVIKLSQVGSENPCKLSWDVNFSVGSYTFHKGVIPYHAHCVKSALVASGCQVWQLSLATKSIYSGRRAST